MECVFLGKLKITGPHWFTFDLCRCGWCYYEERPTSIIILFKADTSIDASER